MLFIFIAIVLCRIFKLIPTHLDKKGPKDWGIPRGIDWSSKNYTGKSIIC